MPPLRDDLLNPLPGALKSENLRYDPVYDKIKEARLEDEDDANPGEWQRARKKADVPAVIKLASDALINRSKDLQLAVWLLEALIRKEGWSAVAESCHLLRELQVRFWDELFPPLENGSPEFRATSQEWFAGRCDHMLRRLPLTKKGLDWLKYHDAHDTSRERAAMTGNADDDVKRAARDRAIAARQAAAQEFDESFKATPKAFYVTTAGHIDSSIEALIGLKSFCEEKYGRAAPNFKKLNDVLEDLKDAVGSLLDKKREKEPDEVPREATQEQSSEEPIDPAPVSAAPAAAKRPAGPPSAQPANEEEACAAIARLAEFLRQRNTASVAPYLLVRSLRWGELRSAGETLDQSLLTAPPTELRQNLRRLFLESNWEELLAAAEAAAVLPCGRGWLDLQRYAWCALNERGYSFAARAIASELRALISDFPTLPDAMLDDATPVANPETKEWLREHVAPPQRELNEFIPPSAPEHVSTEAKTNGEAPPFETALQMARNHHFPEAIELLSRQPVRENSGREKFLRQMQISQLCLATGQFGIAYPILRDLFSEIESRRLLEWESANFVVQPLSLLVRCIDKTSQGAEQRTQIYNLLCRLEPGEALKLQSS